MAVNEVHKDDIGTQFLITVYDGSSIKDISYATTLQAIFRKPNGDFLTKTASFLTDGTDGKLYYTSVSGDLNEVGIWKLQGRIAASNNDKKTNVASFKVHENLE